MCKAPRVHFLQDLKAKLVSLAHTTFFEGPKAASLDHTKGWQSLRGLLVLACYAASRTAEKRGRGGQWPSEREAAG